ncbi:MAG: acylneuraminate cytidylyltransferase family protein, partial [Candidatus Omnitrophota bacterium]
MKKFEVCAVILARAGSRRLPGKNTTDFCGKPLIARTIEAAKNSRYIKRIICSTDSEDIAKISKRCGAEAPFIRPKELALDETSSVDSLLHALRYAAESENYFPEIVVLLQPTSPLRTSRHIDEALELFISKRPKSVVSVKRSKITPPYLKTLAGNKLVSLECAKKNCSNVRKADRDYYCANGAIYITSPETLRLCKTFWTDNTL